jgi:uncharacterized repeat protein (TIGR03803 family)
MSPLVPRTALAIFTIALLSVTGSWAAHKPTEKVLYAFRGADGSAPVAPLVFDAAGNLYGTTRYGGSGSCSGNFEPGCGTVFKLTPSNHGWTQSVLYSFTGGNDGAYPIAPVILDSAGNLYGTTIFGGTGSCYNGTGCGVVFKLSPSDTGWSQTVLYSFTGGGDGAQPYAGLVRDSEGNLYGTTFLGGAFANGTVFELSPSKGGWAEKVLHSFAGDGKGGSNPVAGVIFNEKDDLYGTTTNGPYTGGNVFKLTRKKRGWSEAVLYSFGYGSSGYQPNGGVIFDSEGHLYGTNTNGDLGGCGGGVGCGNVFELAHSTERWKEIVIHSFNNNHGNGGNQPYGGLIFDKEGNLYGTTSQYGIDDFGNGTVFKLTHSGGWKQTVLYKFTGGSDGANPMAGVVRDGRGNLYGTTMFGGTGCDAGCGVVFEVIP